MNKAATPIITTGLSAFQRRLLVFTLYICTASPILWRSYAMFRPGGIDLLEVFLLTCNLLCTVAPIVDYWNAIIGLCIMHFGNAAKSVHPYFIAEGPLPALTSRTALTIFLRNEDPKPIFDRLHAIYDSLSRTGRLQNFRFVLLSDTSRPEIMRMEEEGFARVKDSLSVGTYSPAWYRRRSKNVGFKAGNVYDFVEKDAEGDEFYVALDSDSIMGGDLLVRMASSMENYPQIGLLQTTFAGIPTVSAWARITQFGLRHSVHTYNMGLSWWTNDCAIYWGHNAIIRTQAFKDHCKLPMLPAKPPLGGHVLSHDIIESLFLQRAGYEVRLISIETESYETFPPTFIDHLRRELRWCQGSMQYWFFLGEPGLSFLNRIQICQVIAVYLGPTAWSLMIFAIMVKSLLGQFTAAHVDGFNLGPQMILVCLGAFPKLVGTLHVISTPVNRYGGLWQYILSAILELLSIPFVGPMMSISIAMHMIVSFMGGSFTWDGQNRDRLGLRWRDALHVFWPQTLIGLCIAVLNVTTNNFHTFGARPLAMALLSAVPVAVFTASPTVSRLATRFGFFTAPEETSLPQVLSTVVAPEIVSMSKAHALAKEDSIRRGHRSIRRSSLSMSSLSSLTQYKETVGPL